MIKSWVAITAAISVVLTVLMLSFLFFPQQSEDNLLLESTEDNTTATNLGFTYLPVTPRVSAYYNLGVNSGAMVTEVIPKSPAGIAGVEVGDVILSFNGDGIEEGVPLLGMMMACPANHNINLEIQRGENVSMVEFMHIER